MSIKQDIGEILAIDPAGGESTTGIFHYRHWNDFIIASYKPKEGENWLKQIRNIEKIVENSNIKIIAIETGKLFLNQRYSYHMPQLIKVVGSIEDLADRQKIKYVSISNTETGNANKKAINGEIKGLKRASVLNKNSRWEKQWKFKGQKINEHEKDAILVFYILWTSRLKREWPWTD